MNLYNQTFEVKRFSLDKGVYKSYKDNAKIVGQCDGLYGEDMLAIEYESDGSKLDVPISQFIKSVIQ